MKIDDLGEQLRNGTAALITSEENCLYFTGFTASNGWLVVTKRGCLFLTDVRYIEAAKQEITGCTVALQTNTFEQIGEFIKARKVDEVLIETSRVSVLSAAKYKAELADFKFNYTNELDTYIAELRKIKTIDEKNKILKAQKIAEQAFEATLKVIHPGVAERDVAAELEYKMRKFGGDGVSFDTIVVTGVNSSKPHGVPSDTLISQGDFVTIDFGALYKGYHSDTTRTVAVGTITPEMQHIYDVVLTAQKSGVNEIRAGMTAVDADAICRNIIKAAGYGEAFSHSTGHGVGVEIHEFPTLSYRSKDVISVGNVVTVEPGIYLEGRFGVRIEDMLYITENGAENFVSLPKELITLN